MNPPKNDKEAVRGLIQLPGANPTKNNNLGTFTNRIKDLRLLNRYTQDHVASVLGIPRTVYLNVEQGNRDLKLKEVRILAGLYDMSIDELTYGNPTKNNNLSEERDYDGSVNLKDFYGLVELDLDWFRYFSREFRDELDTSAHKALENRIATLTELKADIWEKL